MGGAKLRHHAPGFVGPAGSEQVPRVRIGQHENEAVAIRFSQSAECENVLRSRIPRQNVPAAAGDIGGLIEALDETQQCLWYDLADECPAIGIARQSLE